MNENSQNFSPDEIKILLVMRKYGPSVVFKVDKRATKNNPAGELVNVDVNIRHSLKYFQPDLTDFTS